MMKKNILLGSVGTGSVATLLGLAGVGGDGHALGYAMCFGLLSIVLFAVGWVTPKD